MGWLLGLALLGCQGTPPPELLLEGPSRIRVENLGPVEGPVAVLSDGTKPDGVKWAAEPESVLRVGDGEFEAVGPGEAKVTAEWNGQTTHWTLIVEPAVMISFVDPPARLGVGETLPLRVRGRIGNTVVVPGEIRWSSSAPGVASVDPAGQLVGIAPGIAYITANGGRGEAMLEIEVSEP